MLHHSATVAPADVIVGVHFSPVAYQHRTNVVSASQKAVGLTVAATVGLTDVPILGKCQHAILVFNIREVDNMTCKILKVFR